MQKGGFYFPCFPKSLVKSTADQSLVHGLPVGVVGGEEVQPRGFHIPAGALPGVYGLLEGVGGDVPLLILQLRRGTDLFLIDKISK